MLDRVVGCGVSMMMPDPQVFRAWRTAQHQCGAGPFAVFSCNAPAGPRRTPRVPPIAQRPERVPLVEAGKSRSCAATRSGRSEQGAEAGERDEGLPPGDVPGGLRSTRSAGGPGWEGVAGDRSAAQEAGPGVAAGAGRRAGDGAPGARAVDGGRAPQEASRGSGS